MIEQIITTLELPGLTSGGVVVDADPSTPTTSERFNYFFDSSLSEEPLAYVYVDDTRGWEIQTLPRSAVIHGAGMNNTALRAWDYESSMLTDPPERDDLRIGPEAKNDMDVLRTATPWQATIVQTPETDPNGNIDVLTKSYGFTHFYLGVSNRTSDAETQIETVRARTYFAGLLTNHLTAKLEERFESCNMPAIAAKYTGIVLSDRTVDLMCVWYMSNPHSPIVGSYDKGVLVPHIYLADMDASPGTLEACPAHNSSMGKRHYGGVLDLFMHTQSKRCIVGFYPAPEYYSDLRRARERNGFLREPIRTKYTGGTDDRAVLVEATWAVSVDPETDPNVTSWRLEILDQPPEAVSATVQQAVAGSVVATLYLADLDTNTYTQDTTDIVKRTRLTTVGDLGIDADHTYEQLRCYVVTEYEDKAITYTEKSIWSLHDEYWPCPISTVQWSDLTGSLDRRGLWWPEEPANQWSKGSSSITYVDHGDSVDVTVTNDWSIPDHTGVAASGLIKYDPLISIRNPDGERVRWVLAGTYGDADRPFERTVTVDTSDRPAWLLVEVWNIAREQAADKLWSYVIELD